MQLAFESAPLKTNFHSLTVHSFPLKKDHVSGGKTLLNKDILRITSTSLKGRHSINTEMRTESFEYGYFPYIKAVFVVQISKVRR